MIKTFLKNIALNKEITGNEIRFILLLISYEELTQSEIIQLTGWQRQMVSRISIGLVAKGIVTKKVKHNLNFYSLNFEYYI